MGELKRNFRPEFLNRVDDLIIFHSLDVEQLAGAIVDQLAELFQEEPRKTNRKTAGLLAPPPNTQGPQGGGARRSTFKEVRRAVA